MANIFIYSNSYNAHAFIANINYLLNVNIDKIILLKENHLIEENFLIENIKICFHNDIYKCIMSSDYVFIINNEALPINIINLINKICRDTGKLCISLRSLSPICEREHIDEYLDNHFNKNFPTVLLLSIGKLSQLFSLEILVHKVFNSYGVNFYQYFNKTTQSVFIELQKHNLVNSKLMYELDNYPKDNCINILSVSIPDNLRELHDYTGIIYKTKSDYTILHTNSTFSSIQLISNYLRYGSNIEIDMVIKSHYSCIQNGKDYYNFYKETIETDEKLIYDIESFALCNKISNNIFAKIGIPEGMCRIL